MDFKDEQTRSKLRFEIKKSINDYWSETRKNRFSIRLSPSSLGEECAAQTFFRFRWVTEPKPSDGRMARYNERGERNEADVVDWLRKTGWTVWETDPNTGKQYAVSGFYGHMYGKCDGVASHPVYTGGVPVLLEFKYINAKRFAALTTKPLISVDLKYYCQVQIYLHEMQLPAAVFIPASRNDEDFEPIIIPYDPSQIELIYSKITMLLTTKVVPARIAQSPAFHKCLLCDDKEVCHGLAQPAKNCRSCSNCVPTYNGKFFCEKWNLEIPDDQIPNACPQWTSIV